METKQTELLIDCNADPFIPQSWEIEKHQKTGILNFNNLKTNLYLSDTQTKEGYISGRVLWKEVIDKKVMNANLLDYLLANPELIPNTWKQKENGQVQYILFWGTIYWHWSSKFCLRMMYWDGFAWRWGVFWPNDDGCTRLHVSALFEV